MSDNKVKELEEKVHLFPEGRVINASFFERDQFNDKSKAYYKIEMAFDESKVDLEPLIDAMFELAEAVWGDIADDELNLPFKDGDKMARARERKGKPGDAYKGMTILRANTLFNKDGEDGPGGIAVYDEDLAEVTGANKGVVYNGCYGQMTATLHAYDSDEDGPAIKCYLDAFQKTGDGEKLRGVKDHSSLFTPKGKADGTAKGARRRRRG